MRIALAQRPVAATGGVSIESCATRRHGTSVLLACALVAVGLAGCSAVDAGGPEARRIPLPKPALLTRQPAPSCEYRAASLDPSSQRPAENPSAATDSNATDQALRAKLDYERQCYRHAELIARSRLQDLQDAVQITAKAVKRSDSTTWTP